MRPVLIFAITFCCCLFVSDKLPAQHDHPDHAPQPTDQRSRSSGHQEGLRKSPPTRFVIVGATVHRSPDADPKIESILIEGSKIVAMGQDLQTESGLKTIDATGKHIYPGLIDAYVGHGFEQPEDQGTAYWNPNVTPQLHVAQQFKLDELKFDDMREAGFTAALIAPDQGIIQGQSSLLLLGGEDRELAILATDVAQHVKLTVGRGGRGGGYPNSPMGAYALARQAMYDAQWYVKAWQAANADPAVERPERNAALDALTAATGGQQRVMIESSNELFAIRADRFAREFGLQLLILGSGNEYRRLDAIADLGRTFVLPVDFAKAPDVASAESAADVPLEALMHWDHAPENPAKLAERNVKFVFTSKGLKKKSDFLKNVRMAVNRGLSPKTALAAMTIDPARLYKVDDLIGSLEKNKIANLMITDGELFDEKTKIVATWVDGVQFAFEEEPLREVAGTWELTGTGFEDQNLVINESKHKLSARIVATSDLKKDKQPAEPEEVEAPNEGEAKGASKKPAEAKKPGVVVKSISLTGTRLSGVFRSDELGHPGISLFSLVVSNHETAIGQITLPNGETISISAKRKESADEDSAKKSPANDKTEPAPAKPESTGEGDSTKGNQKSTDEPKESAEDESTKDGSTKDDKSDGDKQASKSASFPVNYPLGAFGVTEIPEQPKTVLIHNVTVWTLGDVGNLEQGAVLFGGGRILKILAADETLPEADVVIDGQGGHLTPGIIDCHSHMATDSGVNESGQAITAEVRIGDMIDCDDITIYRQLAGGVTSANILHGSANPIGGQNQVIKLRWGQKEAEMKFSAAPQGIKFALGENVKQSNWSNPSGRYPQTRMGVEQIIDDEFRAAIDYRDRWKKWDRDHTGLPPRRDLELDAIVEILEGTRWIHCHSYRQDEILALMRTLESHDITIGTFQHILEGYKVADQMAKHGAMGSAFADWWAYKYEVKDGIPYAGALMHDAGVVVSFNSDDAELGRHLNHEAVKAVRYGGVSEIEALKFVTLNPARQLRIDNRVGSIEPGKDADLVLWTKHPLSNMATVKQTWIDGRKYFDHEEDAEAREQVKTMRLTLIQKILASGDEMEKPTAESVDPASLWPRYDEFCHGHNHDDEHGTTLHNHDGGDHDH